MVTLYVGGTLYSPDSIHSISKLAKWNGFSWIPFAGLTWNSLSQVNQLLTFQGRLYVAGSFDQQNDPGSFLGNSIAAWDGSSWDSLLGGVGIGNHVTSLIIKDNVLYVGGRFDRAGNVATRNLAKWDGHQWCGEWDTLSYTIRSIAFHGDTLVVAAGYGNVNGFPSNRHLAKWIGGSFGDSCASLTSVLPETQGAPLDIGIYPNPATTSFELSLPSNVPLCNLRILDLAGREVMADRAYHAGDAPIDIGALSAALYMVQVRFKNTIVTKKLIKR